MSRRAFAAEKFPVFMIESRAAASITAFRMHDGAMKVALHHHEREKVDPETYDRDGVAARRGA